MSSFNEQVAELKRRLVCDALFRSKGDVKKAAELLGLPRKSLYNLMKRYDIDPDEYRELREGRQCE